MATLTPGQTSDCSAPELDVFTTVNGTKVDVAELEFIIFEDVTTPGTPIQVFPVAGRAAADVAPCPAGHRLALGHYVAEWTVPGSELLGSHQIQWFIKLTPTSTEVTFTEEFAVVAVVPVGVIGLPDDYCSVQDIRDEGVTPALADDAKVGRLITVASRYIDFYTGRFFSPRALKFKLDGRGHPALFFHHPVIAINSVTIELTPGTVDPLDVDLLDLSIYNRHVREGLLDPDDRENPKIEFFRSNEDIIRAAPGSAFLQFPMGRQNIEVDGMFGYTDYDGTALGVTPALICEVCKRITIRILPLKIKQSLSGSGAIWKMVTRDQRVEFGEPSRLAIQGAFTGDPEIDQVLAGFRRPAHIGVA